MKRKFQSTSPAENAQQQDLTELLAKLKKKTYFDILQVGQTCTAKQVSRQFRKLAFKYHPDKNSDPVANQIFCLYNEAQQTLSNEEARDEYIEEAHEKMTSKNVFKAAAKRNQSETTKHALRRMFASATSMKVGRNLRSKPKKQKAPPLVFTVSVTLEQMHRGCEVHHEYVRKKNGIRCANGTPKSEKLVAVISVPPGALDGDVIVHEGMGHAYPGMGTADLRFILKQRKHPVYSRRGVDLYMEREVSVVESVTGIRLVLPSVDGSRITGICDPPLTDGTRVILPNVGMQRKGFPLGERGNVVICVKVKKTMDEDAVKLAKLFAEDRKRAAAAAATATAEEGKQTSVQ